MSQFGTFDNLSDRKDLYSLIAKLDAGVSVHQGAWRRRRLLTDLCQHIGCGSQHIIKNDGTVLDTYLLIVSICTQFQLDIQKVAIWIEDKVRKLQGSVPW